MSLETELWDQYNLCRYGRIDITPTRNERGKLNAAIKQWVEVSATPTILKQKYAAYLRMFPKLPKPTPHALCNQWNALGEQHRPPQASYSLPNVRPSAEGYKQALECLPANLRRKLELKHS